MSRSIPLLLIATLLVLPASGQMQRQRAQPNPPAPEAFWAPSIIGLQSVTQLPARNANVTIHHVFAPLSEGAADLFGLDGAANIRFGLDVGLTDRISVGIGRSRYDKQLDLRTKAALVQQRSQSGSPVSVSVAATAAIVTLENGFDLADRFRYLWSAPVARRFGDRFSLQLSPMWAHANTVYIEEIEGERINRQNDLMAVGVGGRFVVREGIALTFEYVPVIGKRNDDTFDAFAMGLDLETGGHVFQLFVTTANGLTEERMLATTSARALRLGFNVNRVFALGG